MINLSEFVGEIISGLARARSMSDYRSAQLSEKYHADPFIKTLPVPHYTIDEAEIEVPVIVTGIKNNETAYREAFAKMGKVIDEKLPELLERSFDYNYARLSRENEREGDKKEATAEAYKRFRASAKRITPKISSAFAEYIKTYNYKLLKLLDFTEFFTNALNGALSNEGQGYGEGEYPFAKDDARKNAVAYIGNIMFFELSNLISDTDGLQVDIVTSNMNAYDDNGCVMRIKLKVREQDLTLQTEEKGGKVRRYLSLA